MNNRLLVRPYRRIPGPLSLPVVGTLYLYKLGVFELHKYHRVQQHLYRRYGPVVRERIGSEDVVHVFDPDDARTVFQADGRSPKIAPLMEAAQQYRRKEGIALGLGNVNGEEWYRLRSAVRQIMLRPDNVYQFLPTVQQVTQDFIQRRRRRQTADGPVPRLDLEIGKWMLEAAGLICFDKRLGYLDGGPEEAEAEQMIEANHTSNHYGTLLKFSLPVYRHVSTRAWRRYVAAEDILVRHMRRHLEEMLDSVKDLAKEDLLNNRYKLLLSLMANPEIDYKEIVTLVLSLFTDGLNAVVPSVLHNLYNLSANPDCQERAFQEISAVVGSADSVTSAHIRRLNYLKAVVKETFRMYPNGTEVARIIQNDLVLSNYHVPAETTISMDMGVHLMSERYFPSPDEFRPERWLRGGHAEESEDAHPFVLTPFSVGPRACPGKRFSEMYLYGLLAEIIRHFRLRYEGSSKPEVVYRTFLMPAAPILIRFTPR